MASVVVDDDEPVPPGYTAQGHGAVKEKTIDRVQFADAWAHDVAPDGFKFRVTQAGDGGLSVWAENKGNRLQFETTKSVKECAVLISNPAIPTEQFVDMLCFALEENATEGELTVALRRGANDGIAIDLKFAPSRFMTQTFVIELPSKSVDQVGILTAQMQDIWAWKREIGTNPPVVVGKWTTVTAAGNGNFVSWNQVLATPDSFTVGADATQVRILRAGLYKVDAQVAVVSGANANLQLHVNSEFVAVAYASSCNHFHHTYHITDLINVDAGAFLQVQVTFSSSMSSSMIVTVGANRLFITRLDDKLDV